MLISQPGCFLEQTLMVSSSSVTTQASARNYICICIVWTGSVDQEPHVCRIYHRIAQCAKLAAVAEGDSAVSAEQQAL